MGAIRTYAMLSLGEEVKVQGSGFRVQGSGFGVRGSGFSLGAIRTDAMLEFGCRGSGSGFSVQGSEGLWFMVQGSGFRVQGSRFRVQGSVLGPGVQGPGSSICVRV